ncbi:MAG: NAD synthetase [Candidatus Hecatellales archaeon B24]|nr:MAG: NAD synthetase [Candidatus Hecatellales archaeon B24]
MAELNLERLKIDAGKTAERLGRLTLNLLEASKASGVVVGVSGGLDSSTVLALTVKTLGAGRVYAVAMPEQGVTSIGDLKDAGKLAERLGVKFFQAEISPVVKALEQSIPIFNRETLVAWGNLKPRIRMSILYYFANRFNLLVAGTGNKSEILVGYFTKYGDGAADFLPLGGLYKTQVKQLAAYLGIPAEILGKTPTAGLWPGQTDEGELGVKYEVLDLVLHGLVDLRLTPQEVARQTGASRRLIEKVKDKVEASLHKLRAAPILEPF